MKAVNMLAMVLVIVGGLNWGLYAIGYNLVEMLFSWMPVLEKTVYALVALSAVVLIPRVAKQD